MIAYEVAKGVKAKTNSPDTATRGAMQEMQNCEIQMTTRWINARVTKALYRVMKELGKYPILMTAECRRGWQFSQSASGTPYLRSRFLFGISCARGGRPTLTRAASFTCLTFSFFRFGIVTSSRFMLPI